MAYTVDVFTTPDEIISGYYPTGFCNVLITGEVDNGGPSSVEAQVINSDTLGIVVDWTTICGYTYPNPYSGTLTVPVGGWYLLNVRWIDGEFTFAQIDGVNRWKIVATSIGYFSSGSVVDNNLITSYVDASALVTAIQNHSTDLYFDTTAEIVKAAVYYTHSDNRQVKKILHEGTPLTGTTSWSSFARDGTWAKSRILVHNHEGATHDLPRSAIRAERVNG